MGLAVVGLGVWAKAMKVPPALAKLADCFEERNVSLRILTLGVDNSAPAEKLIYMVVAAVTQMERDLIIERTRSALAAKRAAGEKLGGRKQTIPDSKIERAKELFDKRKLTSRETAKLLGISRGCMDARLRDLDPSGWAA